MLIPDTVRDDEIKPTCPKCGGVEFMVVNNSYVRRADLSIVMVTCADDECLAVVGTLPAESVWEDS